MVSLLSLLIRLIKSEVFIRFRPFRIPYVNRNAKAEREPLLRMEDGYAGKVCE